MPSRLLDLLAPPRCAACGARAELPWCGPCRRAARALQLVAGCVRCAGDCAPDDPACPLAGSGLERTVAAFRYTDVVATTVVAAKVGGQHAAWRPLGGHLGSRVRASADPLDLVVPVPGEPGRVRRRGFDHAHLLASAVGAVLDRPVVPAVRARRGMPDRGRGRGQARLPHGTVRAVVPLAGRSVLVVDDVLTTGATMRAAAAALAEAGAGALRAAVLARAPAAAAADPPAW